MKTPHPRQFNKGDGASDGTSGARFRGRGPTDESRIEKSTGGGGSRLRLCGGPGTITLNFYIRDMPAAERSAVLFHEMYHYWDNKVARLSYANVSYGYIDPAHMPEHEYDAYYMTALYWQTAKKDGADDALARCLDRYPTDPDQVRASVDKIVGGKQ